MTAFSDNPRRGPLDAWRASSDQWSKADMEARDYDPAFSCIMELLSRVEALEVAQRQPNPSVALDVKNDLQAEVAELVGLIRQIALAWEPECCLLGNMTAKQLARAADLLEQGVQQL